MRYIVARVELAVVDIDREAEDIHSEGTEDFIDKVLAERGPSYTPGHTFIDADVCLQLGHNLGEQIEYYLGETAKAITEHLKDKELI